ncbi:MAG: copper resistance protein CopC/CopD [Gemmatirosa sp.]|nr:copper resistance protein CopC/CopD [Gemmatirosa sp.]
MRPSPIGRRAARALLALCALLALLAPAVADAHGHLKSAAPAPGARLAAVPRELRLTFTEAPALAFTRVELRDAAGAEVALDSLAVPADAPRAVVAAIRGTLAAGGYTVAWQMAGDDGHVTRGRYAFTILPTAAGLAPPPVARPTPDTTAAPIVAPPPPAVADTSARSDVESPLYAAVRWLQFVGLLAVVGAVAFARVVLPRARTAALAAPARVGAARLGLWAAAFVAAATALRLVAQSWTMRGAPLGVPLGAMLERTTWGHGWLLEAIAVVVAAAGFGAAARGRAGGWTAATLGALALAVTPALSGHAASAPRLGALAIAADALHVIGAAGWLGGLLCVVAVGVPAALRYDRGASGAASGAVADLVGAFSPAALAFAALTVATGLFAAWLHLGAVSALWRSAYGRTLLVKLAALVVVAAFGAYNWRRLRPALGDAALGDVADASRLRRSATMELAFALLVLAVTAVLVATPTPTS